PPARARLPGPLPAPAMAVRLARRPPGSRPARAMAARLTHPRPGSPHGGRGRRRAHGSTRRRYGHVVLPRPLRRPLENAAGRPHLGGTAPRRTRSEGAQHPLTAAPSPEVGAERIGVVDVVEVDGTGLAEAGEVQLVVAGHLVHLRLRLVGGL